MSIETSRGMRLVTSVGDLPQPERLPKATEDVAVIESSQARIIFDCGHEGPQWFTLSVYGERFNEVGNDKWGKCPECFIPFFKEMTLRCAKCGLVVLPGMAVALYGTESEGLHLEIATHIEGGVLGCMRWDCCPSGGFLAGHWTEKGFSPLFRGRTGADASAEINTIIEVDDIQNPE